MGEICACHGVGVASVSGHSPLMKPEAAVPRLTRAIVLADALGARWVNTDEMLKPDWMDDEFAHETMRYTLTRAEQVARRPDVYVCVEPHGVYTKTAAGLRRIVEARPRPHVHAKDISLEHAERERGAVTGTPVGCACGDGMVDWERVVHILGPLDREIVFSVECGTIDQAERSLHYLRSLLR